MINATNSANGQEVANRYVDESKVRFFKADVSDPNQVKEMIAQTVKCMVLSI